MSRLRSTIARALLVLAAFAAGGCPPPGDVDGTEIAKGSVPVEALSVPSAEPKGTQPAEDGPVSPAEVANAPAAGETRMPIATATPKPTYYEHLAGGTFVPRCAACGAVQPSGSTQCAGCGQVLRPWRQEQLCTLCVGSGACERCSDDRVCLDCDGQGVCPYCEVGGKLGADPCFECGGNGKCSVCQGDGRRESVHRDFGPYETVMPGICPTCLGGSGLCPDCGSLTKDRAGGDCLTCAGLGVCFDCGGSGLCPHDAGDGLCLVCGGGGREVLDGDPPKLSDRVWMLRNAAGTPIVGKVLARPDPNVHVQMTQGSTVTRNAFTRAQLQPLTYYTALRDWTPLTDAKGRMELGTVALAADMWPLAQQEFRRAMSADPLLASEAGAQLRDVGDRRTLGWLDAADRARKAGDRDGAVHLLHCVRFHARGTAQATRADVVELQIGRERDEEAKNLDEAARERAAEEAKSRVARVAAGARMRLDRARKLLVAAQQKPADDPGVDRLLARADQATFAAARNVMRGAYRDPPATTPWTVKPDLLVREARLFRAECAVTAAARAIAGGRFGFGERLARRASSLDATNPQTGKLLAEAQLGAARRGVLRGSPAPQHK